MTSPPRFCTFMVGGLYLGIEVERVQEVLRAQRATRVPLASPLVRGLINLRGQIVTAMDLRRRLGIADDAGKAPPMEVVVHTGEDVVSLLVDDIGDVVEAKDATLEPPPPTLQGAMNELIRRVCKLDGRLLLILDVHRATSCDGECVRKS